MIKKILLLTTLSFLMACCSSSRGATTSSQGQKNYSTEQPTMADKIIWTAVSYKGTPYRYGGITRRGMDCSGLVHTSFKARGIELPRSSRGISTKGKSVALRNVRRGDLLFFKTGRRERISHVGLVVSNKNGVIKFIHSTTSRGVIVSSMDERYWKRNYRKAKRVL